MRAAGSERPLRADCHELPLADRPRGARRKVSRRGPHRRRGGLASERPLCGIGLTAPARTDRYRARRWRRSDPARRRGEVFGLVGPTPEPHELVVEGAHPQAGGLEHVLQPVAFAGELVPNHLLGVGRLARVTQRALVFGEGCPQARELRFTLLELVAYLRHPRREISRGGFRRRRPRSL